MSEYSIVLIIEIKCQNSELNLIIRLIKNIELHLENINSLSRKGNILSLSL